jgi:hypothetical protein
MNYLLHKLQLIALIQLQLRRFKCAPGLYDLTGGRQGVRSVGLDLCGPSYAHLGDQLFFQPLLRYLENCGLQVGVAPTKPMREYFAVQGHQLIEPEQLADCDLVITPVWALLDQPTERRFSRCLYVDATDTTIDIPLCGHLVREIGVRLGLPPSGMDDTPAVWADAPSSLALEPGVSYALFNNYVDSGHFRKSRHGLDLMRVQLARLKAEGQRIIHVGSARDRHKDSEHYSGVDWDLRGKTSVADLFYLAAHPQVGDIVAYDNFIMHLGLLHGKRCHIRIRSHTARMAAYLCHCVNPPFDDPAIRNGINYL